MFRFLAPRRGRTERSVRLMLQPLEGRLAPAIGTPTWVEQGPTRTALPSPIINFGGIADEVKHNSGAIQALAVDPSNPNRMFAATIDGGVWRTTNGGDANPTWTPLTDQLPFLGMSDIAVSPVASDGAFNTVYAATGRVASTFRQVGGSVGIYKTTDGGASWVTLGTDVFGGATVYSVVPTRLDGGAVVLAASDKDSAGGLAIPPANRMGLFRSADGGATWTRISGTGNLPDAPVRQVVADPGNDSRFYAAISGQGIWRSDDGGVNWVPTAAIANIAQSLRIKMAVHSSAGGNAVYAAIITKTGSGEVVSGFVRSTDQGATWEALTAPDLGPQSNTHFSIVADPTNPAVVFVGGTNKPHLRGVVTAGTIVWSSVDGVNANNTRVHADSRNMYFAGTDIIEMNDGGLFRLVNPNGGAGPGRQWVSANGSLSAIQFSTPVVYDSLNRVIFGGSQDNGTPQQTAPGSTVFADLSSGDGGYTQVDNLTPGQSVRYSASQGFGLARRATWNNQNQLVRSVPVNLAIDAPDAPSVNGKKLFGDKIDRPQFLQPFAVNKAQSGRLLLGTNYLYESTNGGDTVTPLGVTFNAAGKITSGDVGRVTAIAAGGRLDGAANPDVAFVGTDGRLFRRDGAGVVTGTNAPTNRLYRRTAAGEAFEPAAGYTGGIPSAITLDPDNWRTVYVTDEAGKIWRSTDGGDSFSDITANLGSVTNRLNSVTIYPGTSNPNDEVVFVGARGGVFATENPTAGASATWVRFDKAAPNGPPTFPQVNVTGVVYDAVNNVLVAGTMGRGAWTVPQLSNFLTTPAPVPDVDLNGPAEPGGDRATNFNEGGDPTPVGGAALTVSSGVNIGSASVTIMNPQDGAAETLAAVTVGTSITANYNAATGILNLTGSAPANDYVQVLRSVTFNDTAANPDPRTRIVTITVNNGTANSITSTSKITVVPLNKGPDVDLNGLADGIDFDAVFTAGLGPQSITPPELVVASGSGTLSEARVQLASVVNAGAEFLAATTTGTSITATYNAATGTLMLSGTESLANYLQVLRTVTYNTTATGLRFDTRLVEVTVFDGSEPSATATSAIDIIPANTAPTLDSTGTFRLDSIEVNDRDNTGMETFDFLDEAGPPDRITDPDEGDGWGIAIIGVDNSNGVWQFAIGEEGDLESDEEEGPPRVWQDIGDVSASAARVLLADSRIRFVPNPGFQGTATFEFRAWDASGESSEEINGNIEDSTVNGGTTQFSTATATASIRVLGVTPVAVGPGAGNAPVVRLFDPATGQQQSAFTVFDATFTGGVHVATGDVTGDGVDDFVVGAGRGQAPRVQVYDGASAKLIREFDAFESSFTGGVNVALGDVDRDGFADLILTPDVGGGPRVRVLSGKDSGTLADFFGIEDTNFRGGAVAAVGDLNGDEQPDLAVGAGLGGGPRVATFDGATLRAGQAPVKLRNDYFAFEPTSRNGVYLVAADLDDDGFADLVVGAGLGGAPRVQTFGGASYSATDVPAAIANFFAGNPALRNGVPVAVNDLNGDGDPDVVSGSGAASAARVAGYALDGTLLREWVPFDTLTGAFVG